MIFFTQKYELGEFLSALSSDCSLPHKLHTTPTTSTKKVWQLLCCLRGRFQGTKVCKLFATACKVQGNN